MSLKEILDNVNETYSNELSRLCNDTALYSVEELDFAKTIWQRKNKKAQRKKSTPEQSPTETKNTKEKNTDKKENISTDKKRKNFPKSYQTR